MTALKNFEAVARHQQLKAAAEELFVTPSAVSRQIKQLEDYLGIELFCRDKRAITLTDAGKIYAADLHKIFDEIFNATKKIVSHSNKRTLHVRTSMMSFTQRWLMPRLFCFQQQHPQLEMQLTTCTDINPVDFDRTLVDIGLTRQHLIHDNLVCEPLMPELLVVVCSPVLLKEKTINTINDLVGHQIIATASRSDTWDLYLRQQPDFTGKLTEKIQLAHFFLALEAVISGMGVAVLPLPLVIDDLKVGKLVSPLDCIVPSGETYYVVHQIQRNGRQDVIDFVAWLKEQVERTSQEVRFDMI